MSASPGVMQAMLAQSLMQSQPPSSYGGGGAGPQMQAQMSPMDAAGQLAQKAMLVRALQHPTQQPQQPVQPQVGPGGFPLPPGQPLPQAMNGQPMSGGGINA